MANGSVGYNVNHIQAGTIVPDPDVIEFVDLKGSQNWEPAITVDSTPILGDGGVYATAYGAANGEGDVVFIDPSSSAFAVLNGGVVSSSGTGATVIDRYEQPAQIVPSPMVLSDWIVNIDKAHNPAVAGMRTTVPNATAKPVKRTSGQETSVEWTAETNFTEDANGNMIIYEWMASEPAFTDGVMAVNLVAPTP